MTPFQLETGLVNISTSQPRNQSNRHIILVNRGWVPYTMKLPVYRTEGQIEGDVSLLGLVRASGAPSSCTPENNPVGNYWFWLDAESMAKAVGPSCIPLVVDLSFGKIFKVNFSRVLTNSDNPELPGGYPLAGQTNVTLPNNHLNYTLTWGSLGVALSIMAFRFTRFGLRGSHSAYDAFAASRKAK